MGVAKVKIMYKLKKFSSQIDEKVFEELRIYSKENHIDMAIIITQAVDNFIKSKRIRPETISLVDEIMEEYEEDLEILSK